MGQRITDTQRLVGMTMGARKRNARILATTWLYSLPGRSRKYVLSAFHDRMVRVSDAYALLRAQSYRGARLRPCKGCAECHRVRKMWRKRGGFSGINYPHPTPKRWHDSYLSWDGTTLWIHTLKGKPTDGAPSYTVEICESFVDDGSWERVTCDGSGVIPTRRTSLPCVGPAVRRSWLSGQLP